MRLSLRIFSIVAFTIAAGLASSAATAQTEFKLTASDAAAGDNFGKSVSTDGDYAIVGAYFDDDDGSNSGSAYIFVRSGTTWTEQAKLTASDAAASDYFGESVYIDGDYAIVGAYGNDDDGSKSGSAYIFARSGTTWTQQAKLTASDAAENDRFSYSVSIDGDYAIVGAHQNDDGGNNSGSAYIFVRSGTSWTEQAKLTASDAAASDYFGISVSTDGDYAIVGAYGNDDAGSSSGSAYIFARSGTSWTEQAKLTASDAASGDYFGARASISGDYAIVGAYLNDDDGTSSGSAYIFVRSGTTWTEQAKLTASDAADHDLFGESVSTDGDYAIVGAYFDDDAGSTSGSAYIFVRSGTTWTEQAKLTASDAAENDAFGYSVSIDGDYAIVGASGNDDDGNSSGSAYIYNLAPVATITPPSLSLNDVLMGSSATDSVKVRNTGTGPLSVSEATVTGADSTSFSATPASLSVDGGDSAYVKVTFTPTSVGPKTASLQLAHNAEGSPTSIALSGTGGKTVTDMADTLSFTSDDGSKTKVKFNSGTVTGISVGHQNHGRQRPAGADSSSAPTIPLIYFEINTTLEDTVTFEAMVSFQYTQALLDSAGITDETTLKLFRYDSDDGIWMQVESAVDISTKTVSATTNSFVVLSIASVTPTGIDNDNKNNSVPAAFSLAAVRPNPFNPSTTIAYEVPVQTHITLTVYNLLGQEVLRLVDQVQAAGRYEAVWNGTNITGAVVSSGIYLYRITSGSGYTETKRMTLLK